MQEWTEADTAACNGKRVAVIGSGATAATLIPALAPTVEHVTMVQRSPTYFVARSAEGSDFTQGLHRWAKKVSHTARFCMVAVVGFSMTALSRECAFCAEA